MSTDAIFFVGTYSFDFYIIMSIYLLHTTAWKYAVLHIYTGSVDLQEAWNFTESWKLSENITEVIVIQLLYILS